MSDSPRFYSAPRRKTYAGSGISRWSFMALSVATTTPLERICSIRPVFSCLAMMLMILALGRFLPRNILTSSSIRISPFLTISFNTSTSVDDIIPPSCVGLMGRLKPSCSVSINPIKRNLKEQNFHPILKREVPDSISKRKMSQNFRQEK